MWCPDVFLMTPPPCSLLNVVGCKAGDSVSDLVASSVLRCETAGVEVFMNIESRRLSGADTHQRGCGWEEGFHPPPARSSGCLLSMNSRSRVHGRWSSDGSSLTLVLAWDDALASGSHSRQGGGGILDHVEGFYSHKKTSHLNHGQKKLKDTWHQTRLRLLLDERVPTDFIKRKEKTFLCAPQVTQSSGFYLRPLWILLHHFLPSSLAALDCTHQNTASCSLRGCEGIRNLL